MNNRKLEQVEILKLYKNTTKKDGSLITDFRGNPATKITIKTKQHGDTWLYSYPTSNPNDDLLKLTENMGVELIIWESNGFWNFKLPSKLDKLEIRVSVLEEKIAGVKSEVAPAKEDEIDLDDLPF